MKIFQAFLDLLRRKGILEWPTETRCYTCSEAANCPAFDTAVIYYLLTAFVDDNTIMVHIRRLRVKIEDDPNRPVYLKTVRGVGYQFVLP